MAFLRGPSEKAWATFPAALAFAVVLALVWAPTGVARADDPPSATYHLTSEGVTFTTEDGEEIEGTIVSTVVDIDFGDALLADGIDPSAVTVTVDGVPLDYTKHAFTFHNQRLSVSYEEWREGAVTEAELEQRRSGNVSVSYVPPADTDDERLRYESGSAVETFEVTASLTTEERSEESFVVPDEPGPVTTTIRGNASPTKSETITVAPGEAGDAGTSAVQTEEEVTDLVQQVCKELGGSCS